LRIELNSAEKSLAINLAIARNENARSKGKPNFKLGKQADWLTDLEGIAGEIAACRYFKVYPDTETNLTVLPGFDLMTWKGSRVDVKTTKYRNGKLLATLKKDVNACDIYVLVVGEFPTYELVGYATSGELIQEKNIMDLGHGKGYALSQDDLRRFT
jgi:hypothetical protein